MLNIEGCNIYDGARVFRGYLAPASLKHAEIMQYQATAVAVFRGYLAPASLKQAHPGEHCRRRLCFPWLSGPGLIEAYMYFSSTVVRQKVFRGYLAPASLKQF